MPVLKFWDAALQQYVPISAPAGSGGGPDEVAIGPERPPDNTDLWVDVDDDSGSGSTGVTDHGALTGLGDNDHPQYAMVTYVDQLITVSTVGPVDGTDVPARDNLLWVQVPA